MEPPDSCLPMPRLPRLAVGTIAADADATALLWGLLAALEATGQHVQAFRAKACFAPRDGATVITGRPDRHLDSWLMTPEACRQALLRGTTEGRLAAVEGEFAPAVMGQAPAGGQFEPLCDWLDLPRLAVVDVSQLTRCRVPERPNVDGLLLDRVVSDAELYRAQTLLESLWRIPVLGAMEEAPPCAGDRQLSSGRTTRALAGGSLGQCLCAAEQRGSHPPLVLCATIRLSAGGARWAGTELAQTARGDCLG